MVKPGYIILPVVLQPPSIPPLLLPAPLQVPELSLMVGSKHLPLHWSISGCTSPGTATLGSCLQAPLNHDNSVGFGVCKHDVSSGGDILQLSLPSVSLPFFVSVLQEHFWVIKKKS